MVPFHGECYMRSSARLVVRSAQSFVCFFLFTLIALFGVTPALAQSSVSASTIAFGNVVVNETSTLRSVTFTNTGGSVFTLGAITVAPVGSYVIDASSTCPTTPSLAHAASCTVVVRATPTSLGAEPAGTLTINATPNTNTKTVALSATGIAATAVSTTSLNLGPTPFGEHSTIFLVKVTNNQLVPLNFTPSPVTGTGFASAVPVLPTVACPTTGSIAAGANCSFGVVYTPTGVLAQAGTLTINTDAGGAQPVALSGTGIAPTSISTNTLSFGNVVVNNTSAILSVTFKNFMGYTPVNFSAITLAGGGGQYSLSPTSTCAVATPVPFGTPGNTCTLAFTFLPTSIGVQPNATVTLVNNATNSPLVLTLKGSGVPATQLSPASTAFGSVPVNTVSATKLLTIKNNSTILLTLNSVIFNGPFALDTTSVIANPCPIVGGTLQGNVASGASCNFGVTFNPTALGATAGGKITVLDNDPTGPVFAALSGSGVSPLALAPATAAFGNVAINTSSADKNFTLFNSSNAAITPTSISVAAPYSIDPGPTTCAAATPIATLSSCVIAVKFSPTVVGASPASLQVVYPFGGGTPTASAALTGTGMLPVVVAPATVGFGNVVVGQPINKTITLTNFQATPLTISSITGFPSQYSINAAGTTCPLSPLTVPGYGSGSSSACTISLSLNPTAVGSQAASLTINDDSPSSPHTVALTGTGIQPVLFAPTTLSFGNVFIGANKLLPATVKNMQVATPLSISGATISGTNASEFAVTSLCPASPATLPASGTCVLNVTFTPTGSGTRTATLNLADDAAGSPQALALTGSALAPLTVLPTSITSYSANVGAISAYQTITLKNTTTNPITISSFQLSGDFQQTSTNCGATSATPPPYTLAGGASCSLTVSFSPTIGGTRTGQLQVYDSVPTSPQVVNLSGTGNAPLTVAPGSLAFTTQTVGTTSAAKTLILTNHESKAESFSLTPTGDFGVTTGCPAGTVAGTFAIGANATCPISVTFSPSSATPTARTGSLSIAHTAANGSPIGVGLSGSASTTPPAAAVSSVSPGAGAAGTSVPVVITGNGWTHFNSSSVITFIDTQSSAIPSDISVSSFTATTANQINATLSLGNPPSVVYGARNISIKTPTGGGHFETAILNSAFILGDPTNSHVINTVTPAFGTQGQSLTVAIAATGTHFVGGVTYANFGDGISVNWLNIVDSTHALASINISPTTPTGYRTLSMMTGGEYAVSGLDVHGNGIFQIGASNAALITVSPSSAPQGFAGPVTLTATGTHFLQSATVASISGATVGNVTVLSPTQAVAQVIVPAGAGLGPQNVTVSTGGEIVSLANSFTITGATPALLAVTPSSGVQGQTLNVVVTGNAYTNFVAGQVSGNFTGEITVNSTTVNNPHQVTFNITISPNANVGGITANLGSGPAGSITLFPFGFTVTPSAAQITGVVPNCVPQGGQLTLNVSAINTNWVQGTTIASFYPVPVPMPVVDEVTINSPTSAALNIAVPTNTPPGTYAFYMATGGQVVSSSVCVYPNTPVLNMSPANGLVLPAATNSFTVNFTGQFTHWTQAGTLPVIDGQGVTLTGFTVNSPVSATATLNIAPGSATGLRLVTFTTGGEIVTTYFNVTVTPVGIIAISPYHAAQNQTLNVEIIGLNTHWAAGSTQVLFGNQITVNSVTVHSATDLTANITTNYILSGVPTSTPPGGYAVYVNTGAEQVITGFTVDPPATPRILAVNPPSAAQGATVNVTVTGDLTSWANGSSELILGAGVTVSNLNVTSPTSATATIAVSPTAPIGGNSVVMITGPEYDTGTGFSVTKGTAYIQSVSPHFNCTAPSVAPRGGIHAMATTCVGGSLTGVPIVAQLQTVTLNVVGVGTHWLQGETAFNFVPGVILDSTTVTSPTTATIQITVLSSAPVGFAPISANTDGEVAGLAQAIDIEQGSPIMVAFSPYSGQQGITFDMPVLGRFTHWAAGATSAAFNQDITVNSINVVDSETLIANVTISPWAYVDYGTPCGHVLTVTTGSEQVSMQYPVTGTFCVTQGAEQINSVTPNVGVQGSTQSVTIVGSATNFLAGQTQVSFNDSNIQVGQINVIDATHLSVPIAVNTSSPTGFKTVTVTTYGQVASQQYAFTVSPGVAQLTEAIPNQAEQGSPLSGQPPLVVRLIGQYSHFNTHSTATFGPGIVVNSVQFVSLTEIDATITIDPLSYTGGRLVTVTTPGVPCSYQPATNVAGVSYPGCTPGSSAGTGSEIVTNNAFTIIPGPAIISQVAPNTGNEGQEIIFNLTGANTHWQQGFTQFYIAGGGYDITINSVTINSATSATVDMNIAQTANPGPRSVYMVTAGESLTNQGAFVVTGGIPAVSYLTPNNALKGTTGLQVTIVGNAYTQWDATSTVSFGPGITIATGAGGTPLLQIDDASHIEAVINVDPAAQVGYRTVVVQTGTQALTGSFQVTAPAPPPTPFVWEEIPSSAIPGQTLTVNFTGLFTHWDPASTTFTGFGSDGNVVVNTFQVTGATTARANITVSPTAYQNTYYLSLTTGSEVDNVPFTVYVAQPTLTIVDPGSAMQGAQDVIVNVLGQYTAFDATTTFSFGNGIIVNGPPAILGPTIARQSISIPILQPTGGYPVVAVTADAVGSQHNVGGAGFGVTPSLALIATVTPNTAPQGSTIVVDIQGQNTHWNNGTVFQFGAGIVVSNTLVNSATDATLTLVIPALAPLGTTGASATTGGENAYIQKGFVVQAGTPLLLSSGPGSLPQQSTAIFTILSQATTWSNATPPTVDLGPGIVVSNINVTSPTSMTVQGFVTATTPTGYRNLTVSTGTQTLSLNNVLYVTPGPAVINSITPNSGGQGVNLPSVAINGINTHWLQGVTQLTFPGVVVNSFTVNTPTSITANITVNVNSAPGQYTISATTLGEVATEVNAFTVIQTQAQLLAIVPNSAVLGWTGNVTFTGFNTHFTNSSVVSFGVNSGITVNNVTANTATSLVANITVSPTTNLGYRTVSVTTGAESVSITNGFTVNAGPAAITGILPASGAQGTTGLNVVVTGSQSHFLNGTTTAAFGGGIVVTNVAVTDSLHATVTINIPSGTALGAYNASLTTGGEVATILGGFTVSPGTPIISLINPATGHQGATHLSVTLTGLFTHFVNATSVANFGAGITVNSTTVTNATTAVADITIQPTATLGSRSVSVVTNAETASITGGFTVLAGIPALSTIAPVTGSAGSTLNLVVNGAFTTFQQGFSSVAMGDGIIVNFVTVNNIGQLTANITIPANAAVANTYVSVTTNGTTLTLNNAFAVTAGTPIITVISPNIGNPGQSGLTVTITGQYTTWTNASTVTFGTAANGISVGGAAAGTPGPVVTATPTSITVSLNIAAGAPVGPVTVSVTTGAQTQTVAGGFTVQAAVIPAPYLISLSPGSNAGGVPTNSSIIAVFSQPMNRTTITTSSVYLQLTSNQGQGWLQVPATVSVDVSGRVATLTPTSLLAVNSTYYLTFNNTIRDAAGNTFNNFNTWLYTVDSANQVAPTVITVNPPVGSTVGTNVPIQVQFSTDMNQTTQAGLTVKQGATPVAGTYSWNAPLNCCSWGPGNVLTFTPSAPLAPGATYTVAWNNTLADTAGNALVPGSFTFTTGAGPDTANSSASGNFNGQSNLGTNFVPVVTFAKPMNPLLINTNTLLLYNADSGKYVGGTVTVGPQGLTASFTPTVPLLPSTYYRLYQAGGYLDAEGNYLSGVNLYFTTGTGTDNTAPTVTAVSPVNSATNVPLNSQVVVRFSKPINPSSAYQIQVTPFGGSPIVGTTSLAGDQVTLSFTPTASSSSLGGALLPNTQYTVQVSGYVDYDGNSGSTFTSNFTTAASTTQILVSTGLDASGNLITNNTTPDGRWTVVPTASAATGLFSAAGVPQPLYAVQSGNADWYSGWPANGPNSASIAINPNSATNNTYGVYSMHFNIPGAVPSNLCLDGYLGVDDNGMLGINGTAISGNYNAIYGMVPVSLPVSAYLTTGTNTLSLAWGGSDNSLEMFRLQAVIETCGASSYGSFSLSSATPAYNATGVSTATTISLNFNHTVDPLTVNANTLPIMIGWNSNQQVAGTYTVSGNNVLFTPAGPLPINTTIWVGACGGPLDLVGNSAGGCYTQLTYFTTGSTVTPPLAPFQVTAFTPANNATNVGLRAPVAATFNRSFNSNTINQNAATMDFALFNGDSQYPWCTGYIRSQDNTTLYFNCNALPSSANMTAMLNSNIKDWSGNSLANFTSEFQTSQWDANSNGTVTATRPGNGAGGIDPNEPLTLFFNYPINAATANSGLQVAQNNVNVPGSISVQDGGYTLVFTPSAPFTAGALVQWWTTGSLTDTNYNTPITAASGYFYVANTTATTVPSLQVSSPNNGTYNIPLNTVIDVQFNTPLDPATVTAANVYITGVASGAYTMSQPAGQPNVVRFTPVTTWPASTYLYLYYNSGLHSSTSVPASGSYIYFYTGTAVDATTPVITSIVPYNGAGNIGVNIAPGFISSKPVDPITVTPSTFQLLNGAVPLAGTFWFNSSNTRVGFTPNAPLPPSTSLTLRVNGVTDLEGHTLPVTNSTFQTGSGPDFQAPWVATTSIPSSGVVPTNTTVTVQFSEPMDPNSFIIGQPGNCANIYIYDGTFGGCIATTVSWSADQTTAYITPTAPLAAGRYYILYINGGDDIAGNQMSGFSVSFSASFSAAASAPGVLNFNPIGGLTGVGTNAIVQAHFSAPIDPNYLSQVTLSHGGTNIAVTPVLGAGNTVLQLVPAVPLAPSTTYTMTVQGVRDPAGNIVATVTNSFTTGTTFDLVQPYVTVVDPPDYSTVGTNITMSMVFSKPLNPITVDPSNFRFILSDTGQWIPYSLSLSSDGKKVTLSPWAPLLPNTMYYFQTCCNLQDANGNTVSGLVSHFYTGNGAIVTGPTVTAISPVNLGTAVPINAQVVANISAVIDPTSWSQNSITVLDSSSHPVPGTVSQSSSQGLQFVPAANLATGMTYTVHVGNYTDAAGNFAVPFTSTFTTSAVATGAGMQYTGSNITNGTTYSSGTLSSVVLTFNNPINPESVNVNTIRLMNGWNSNMTLSATYAVSGNTITITPTSPFPAGANIYVGSCNGPTDLTGSTYAGCWNQLAWFTWSNAAPDLTPLTVVSVNPVAGATNVRHETAVSVTFNKPINPYTIWNNGYNAQLYAGQYLEDNGQITMSADNRSFTFNSGALWNGTTYTIALPAAGIADMSGNTLATPFLSTFTTSNNPATGSGSVIGTTPGNNTSSMPVNTNLTLYLNRPVVPSTLPGNLVVTVNGQVWAGAVSAQAGGYEVVYTPGVSLPNSALVQWFFSSSVQDTYGDYFNGASGYYYTVAATNPAAQPTIVAVSPACCGSTNIPTNAQIDVLFSSPIDSTTLTTAGNNNIYLTSGPATTLNLSVPAGMPNVVRMIAPAGWAPNTYFYICSNGQVKGTNGVAVPSACYTTYFQTAAGPDTTPGTLTVGPPNGAQNVGTNAYIRVNFSKPADRATVNSTNIVVTQSGNPINGYWTFNYSGNDLYGANYYPYNPLPASSTIQVAVNGVIDYAGNSFNNPTITFTTGPTPDYSTPTVSLDFNGNTYGIGTNAIFTCRYSEPMDPSSINQGNTYLYSYVTNARVPTTYSWSPDMMTLTMVPFSLLFANSEYNYYCQNGLDLTGNAQQNSSSYFWTAGGPVVTPLTLLAANPPNGATNVAINTNQGPWVNSSMGLLFSAPVAADSLGQITITPSGGSPIPVGITPEYGNQIGWISLPYSLSANTHYTINVNGVTDLNGNPMASTTSSFTTGNSFDFTQPSVTATVPVNGAASVAVSTPISVTFSKAMDPVLIDANHIYVRTHNTQTTIPGVVTLSADFKTVTITPTVPLAGTTIYDILVTNPSGWCLYDQAGNYMNNCSQVVSTFTTNTPVAVNGVCGSSNGGSFTTPPSANLCSVGTATALNNNAGSFTWTCNGQYSGTNASCSATITPASACYSQSHFSAGSLVSWWKGDGDATDHMGLNNGTLQNGASNALGEVNDSFSFNGSNQYVLVGSPVPASLQLQNQLTLQAWIYVSSLPPDFGNGALGLIVGSQHDGGPFGGATIFYDGRTNPDGVNGAPPGHIHMNIGDSSGNGHATNTLTQVPMNQWVLITATATSGNPFQIYYNGVLQPSGTTQSTWNGTVGYSGSWFAIGQEVNQNRPFNGLIDEVQVFNQALTPAQIQGVYNAGNAGVCP